MPLHLPLLLRQLAVASQMMTAYTVMLDMECHWNSSWRVSGVEVELAWCKTMPRSGPAHPTDRSIMLGMESCSITGHNYSQNMTIIVDIFIISNIWKPVSVIGKRERDS
jgi:hypothetical protein